MSASSESRAAGGRWATYGLTPLREPPPRLPSLVGIAWAHPTALQSIARRWLCRLRLGVLGLALLAVWLALPATAGATVHTGRDGIELIKHFEGFRPSRYVDPAGLFSQCYGATGAELAGLPPVATEAQCDHVLRLSLARTYEPPVRMLFVKGGPLHGAFNQHRFDALASFALNTGIGTLGSLTAGRTPRQIAAAFPAYNHDIWGRALPGLTLRRHAEADLFSRPMGRFELWPRYEIRLVRHLERLRGHSSPRARRVRAEMRARIAIRVGRLRHVIHREHDGLSHRRLDRLKALDRRLPHATTGVTR